MLVIMWYIDNILINLRLVNKGNFCTVQLEKMWTFLTIYSMIQGYIMILGYHTYILTNMLTQTDNVV